MVQRVLRQIKRVIKLQQEKEKIENSLEYYRIKLAKYVLQTGREGGGFSYGMHSKVGEDINISASPLFPWSREIDERTSVHIYNKKTEKSYSIYKKGE